MRMKNILSILLASTMLVSIIPTNVVFAKKVTTLKPTIISVSETGNANVTIKWKSVKGIKKYQVYRNKKKIGTVSKTSYVDKSTKDATRYSYAIYAVKGNKKITSKVKKIRTSGAPKILNFRSTIDGSLVNTNTKTTFTAEIKNSKRVKKNTVILYQGDNKVGVLRDDGKSGDTKKNDGVYSIEKTVEAKSEDLAFTVKLRNKKKTLNIPVFKEPTEEDFEHSEKVSDEIGNKEDQFKGEDGYVLPEKRQDAIDAVYQEALKAKKKGELVYVKKETVSVVYKTINGFTYVYTPSKKNSMGDKNVGNYSFSVYSPYQGGGIKNQQAESKENSYSQYIKMTMGNSSVEEYVNDNATVDNLVSCLTANKYIVLHTHGCWTESLGSLISTGQKATFWQKNKFWQLFFLDGRLAISEDDRILVSPYYLDSKLGNKALDGSIVYNGMCDGMHRINDKTYDSRLADVLLKHGAKVYMGYSAPVYNAYSTAMGRRIIKNWAQNKMSIEKAIRSTKDLYGQCDEELLNYYSKKNDEEKFKDLQNYIKTNKDKSNYSAELVCKGQTNISYSEINDTISGNLYRSQIPYIYYKDTNTLMLSGGTVVGGNLSIESQIPYEDYSKMCIKRVYLSGRIVGAKNLAFLFGYLNDLEEVSGLSNIDTSNVVDMTGMFGGCYKLNRVYMNDTVDEETGFRTYDVQLKGLNTSKVTNMSQMFSHCLGIRNLEIDFDTSKVEDMSFMFCNCGVQSIKFFGKNFSTANVKTMSCMFAGDTDLSEIIGLNRFNTSNVTSMHQMFHDSRSLYQIDLSSFSTKKLEDVDRMFDGCKTLQSILIGNDWDMSNLNASSECMFRGCDNLDESLKKKINPKF